MTPLEELQAAHRRLSELRTAATPGPWRVVNDDDFEEIDIAGASPFNVGSTCTAPSAALIVTLNRTIGAQLALITSALHMRTWGTELDVEDPIIALARAINGEAS